MKSVTDAQSILAAIAFAAAVLAALASWGWIAVRAYRGRTVLQFVPRRPVPWKSLETMLLLLLYLAGMLSVQPILTHLFGIAPQFDEKAAADATHPVIRLLQDKPGPATTLLCLLSVALVAPLVEEFFFRVVLQGWLESQERRLRRECPWLRRVIRGLVPVGIVALAFAAMHARGGGPTPIASYLRWLIAVSATVNAFSLAIGLLLLRAGCQATWTDLGWDKNEFWPDVRRGLLAFAALAAPAYAVQFAAQALLAGRNISPDPAGLILFALGMGVLYYRTHRIMPSIVLHMALNASSFILLVL